MYTGQRITKYVKLCIQEQINSTNIIPQYIYIEKAEQFYLSKNI